MAITVTQLYNKNFFSQVGTEYVCTGFMFGPVAMQSLEAQLSKEGFMTGIDVTQSEEVDRPEFTPGASIAAAPATAQIIGANMTPGSGY